MSNYLKANQDRWNHVNNDYTEPVTHEELEEAKKHPISVALTVGKKVPKDGLKKLAGKDIRISLRRRSAGSHFCRERV